MKVAKCSLCGYNNESETAFCTRKECPLMIIDWLELMGWADNEIERRYYDKSL